MSRTKGATAEREVVQIIREHGWQQATRTSDGRRQFGRGDVAGGPAGVHIEVKRQEKLNVPAAFRQIESDADVHDVPVLVHRPSRQQWMATLPLDELLALLKLKDAA
jgi:Holliday junction resolvase